MASFPAIVPTGRRYGFGLFPVTSETSTLGGSVRFLHGTTRYGIELELDYQLISEAEAFQIRTHYRGQDGGTRSFMLPSAIWTGHSSPANIVPLGTTWLYVQQPEETHRSGLLFDVAVKLLQVV